MSDPFLAPSLAPAKMDRYLPRQAILQATLSSSTYLTGRCLDVGSGDKPYWPLLRQPPFQISELLGLWLHRWPMNRSLRKTLILLLYPIWTVLRLTPEPDSGSFDEGQMIAGLMAIPQRPATPKGSLLQ